MAPLERGQATVTLSVVCETSLPPSLSTGVPLPLPLSVPGPQPQRQPVAAEEAEAEGGGECSQLLLPLLPLLQLAPPTPSARAAARTRTGGIATTTTATTSTATTTATYGTTTIPTATPPLLPAPMSVDMPKDPERLPLLPALTQPPHWAGQAGVELSVADILALADDPFWRRARRIAMGCFWMFLVALIAAVVVIVVNDPQSCSARTPSPGTTSSPSPGTTPSPSKKLSQPMSPAGRTFSSHPDYTDSSGEGGEGGPGPVIALQSVLFSL